MDAATRVIAKSPLNLHVRRAACHSYAQIVVGPGPPRCRLRPLDERRDVGDVETETVDRESNRRVGLAALVDTEGPTNIRHRPCAIHGAREVVVGPNAWSRHRPILTRG